jgi:hypothetical protein
MSEKSVALNRYPLPAVIVPSVAQPSEFPRAIDIALGRHRDTRRRKQGLKSSHFRIVHRVDRNRF